MFQVRKAWAKYELAHYQESLLLCDELLMRVKESLYLTMDDQIRSNIIETLAIKGFNHLKLN
jgi:hypothetical protein